VKCVRALNKDCASPEIFTHIQNKRQSFLSRHSTTTKVSGLCRRSPARYSIIWKNWISDSQKVELSQMGIRDCAYYASVFPVNLLNDSKRTLQLSSLPTTHSRMLFIWKGHARMTPHCGYIGRRSQDMRASHRYKELRRTSSNTLDQITGASILAVLL
jgi:hypothetical protein